MRALSAGNGIDDGPPTDRPVAQIDPVPRVSIQAFCELPDLAAVVGSAMTDRRMAKAHVKLNMGGAPAAVEAYKSAPTPNAVVLEAPAGRDALLGQLEELAQFCDAGTKVVVLGKLNDIVLYRQLIARGVSEYLVAPFGVVDFVQAMSQLFSVPGAKSLGRVNRGRRRPRVASEPRRWLTIWRGLFASLTEMATIIADFDLAFGTAGLDYNQDPPQGVAEAVFAPERVDTVLVERLLSKCGDHLSLLAARRMWPRASTVRRARSRSPTAFAISKGRESSGSAWRPESIRRDSRSPRSSIGLAASFSACFSAPLPTSSSKSALLTLLIGVTGTIGLPQLTLARLRIRRINKFIANFPTAIDIIVRGIKSGLPLGDTIRIAAAESPMPVKSEFRRVVESLSLGMTLPEAVERMAQRVPITETNFFSIVIAIQGKSGGNLSEAMGNLSRVLRERKKMKGKISAMSMEAKASAAIIGAVPFLVVGALYVSSPNYVSLLWTTSHGRMISVIAICWMGVGVAMMKKMIAFDF